MAIDSSGFDITGGGSGGSGLGNLFGNNPGLVGTLGGLGAAGLAVGLLNRGGDVPFSGQAQGVIAQQQGLQQQGAGIQAGLSSTAGALTQPLFTGQLPSDAEQSIQNQLKQAQDQVRARFASLGQTGSTMEADTLADLTNKTSAMRFQIAQNMAQLGAQYSGQALQMFGMEGNLLSGEASGWQNLMQQQMAKDKQTSDALGGFFNAVGGSLAKALPMML